MKQDVRIVASSVDGLDPYLQTIANMAEIEFPGTQYTGSGAIFEAVAQEVVGTKQHRFGPTPSPESLVMIRKVISDAMKLGMPVPILVPWGGSKQGPWGVDLAEVMALKQLVCLNARVTKHYAPGISVRIRLEDMTDDVMFKGTPGWGEKTENYVSNFSTLHEIFASDFSHLRLESDLMEYDKFSGLVDLNVPYIKHALGLSAELRDRFLQTSVPEWRGGLPENRVHYYRTVYSKFYPEDSADSREVRLATYFASSLARFLLNGSGKDNSWPNFITLSFTSMPWRDDAARVYYRTIPEKYTNQHRPPWIGKGYVRISERSATPAIAGWTGDNLPFVSASLSINDRHDSVRIAADYIVQS